MKIKLSLDFKASWIEDQVTVLLSQNSVQYFHVSGIPET